MTDEVIRGGAQAQTEATSETPKFTPGPWSVRTASNGDCGICADGTGIFAECFADIRRAGEGACSEAAANAHLIKESPNLYQSVLDLLEIVDTSHPSAPAFIDEARTALRKANGGE